VARQHVATLIDETVGGFPLPSRAIDQSPVKITCVVDGWIDGLRTGAVNELILRSTCGIGLAATKPSFLLLVHVTRDHAVQILAFIDITKNSSRYWADCPASISHRNAQNRTFGYLAAILSTCGSK